MEWQREDSTGEYSEARKRASGQGKNIRMLFAFETPIVLFDRELRRVSVAILLGGWIVLVGQYSAPPTCN